MAADLPLVGRRAELAVLISALTPGSGPRVVVLVGEAGVGKTRLISEAIRRCGWRVLTGGCLPLAESVPFLPVTEALHTLSPNGPPPALAQCAGYVRAELARLMPGWDQTAMDHTEPPTGWARGRLFAALRDLFAALAAEAPHALVLDDVHWADASTLDFMAYHCATDRDGAMPMVLTCREEIDPAHPAGSWLAELTRRPEVTRVRLGRLSRGEVAEHVGGLLGRAASPSYVDELYARAAGNAFFTEQLVAAGDGEPGAALPDELAQLLVARAAATGADARGVLGVLGLAGRPVDEGLLTAVTGLAGPDLASVIHRLTRSRLVEPPAADGRYRLRHALVGEAVTAAMTTGERRDGHARLARVLGDGAPTDRAGEVAEHWAAAGRVADEAPWRVTAAREAERVSAHREAATHWLRLIELRPHLPSGLDLADAYLSALAALDRYGDSGTAAPLAEKAIRVFDPGLDPERLALLYERVATYRWLQDQTAALAPLEHALNLLSGLPPGRVHAMVMHAYASILDDDDRTAEARKMLEEGLEICRAAGLTVERIKILRNLASIVLENEGDLATGLRLRAEAMALAERYGEPALANGVAFMCAEDQLMLGNLSEAAEIAGAALDKARRAGLERHVITEFLAGCYFEALAEQGRPADAEMLVPADVEATPVSGVALTRAYLEVLTGDHGRAIARLASIDAAISPINLSDAGYLAEFGEIDIWLAQPGKAIARIRRMGDKIAGLRPWCKVPVVLRVGVQACADLAEAARARADTDGEATARRWAEELVATHGGMRPDPFALHRYLTWAPAEGASWRAELTRVVGTPNPAAWAETADEWARLGRPHRTAYARWRQGEAFLAGGHRTDAAHALRAAADGADGNAPLLAGIQETARLARMSLRTEEPATASSPYGLTAREQAVLALIAEGLTNVRIGRRLFISESTVSVHVTNLMRKLGVTNRAQAAAIAQRAGLIPERHAEH